MTDDCDEVRLFTRRRALVLAAVWALVGAFLAVGSLDFEQRVGAHQREWGSALADGFLFAGTWFVLSLGVVWLCQRHPFGRDSWRRSLLRYGGAGIAAAVAHLAVYLPLATLANRFAGSGATMAMVHRGSVRTLLPWNLITFTLVCLVASTIAAQRRLGASEATAARLAVQLAEARASAVEARASALEARMQPHFLFNALHSIMVLMHRDVGSAAATLTRLSALLRHALAESGVPEATLGEELDFALGYLEIERVRFPDRLTVDVDVPSGVRGARLPRLLLQPLVENAVRHGIAQKAGPGCVAVRASRDGTMLTVEVADTGPGVGDELRTGVGLSTTRERLRVLYGDRATLTIARAEGGGTVVRVALPYAESAPMGALGDERDERVRMLA